MARSLNHTLAWAYDGAAHLRSLMSRMGDDAFHAPSGLPGWSRAHLLTHVARNAEAMVNLLTWARSGVETPAYVSLEQRDTDIEAGAKRPAAVIRDDVAASSDTLARVVRAMPEPAWSARVTMRGREIPARDIPWFRAREMWIHAVDLDVGASFEDLPDPMLVQLIDDVVASFATREDCPALLLVSQDQRFTWTIGDAATATTVTGTAAGLAGWLLGRSRGRDLRTPDRRRPQLPSWL